MSPEELFASIDPQQAIKIVSDPALWAEAFLKVPDTGDQLKINHVQKLILASNRRFIVVRVHRRAGKSYTFAILALYHALTTESCEILIVCPQQQQVAELFSKIREFIRANDWIQAYKENDGRSPQHIEFKNGSRVLGFTTGARQKSKAMGLRGQGADIFLIDEAAYLNEEDWEAIKPIMWGDKHRVNPPRVYVASTPSYTRGMYYDLCVKPEFAKYWHRIHVSVADNPEWTERDIEDVKATSNELEWQKEWLAEFPEFGEGVFPKKMVDRARKSFTYDEYKRLADEQRRTEGDVPTRTMGVDWDKHNRDGHGPNIVILEAVPNGKYRIVLRQEIPQSEFALSKAVERVIELNELFEPKWIFIDRGYGEYQLEELWKYGKQFKHTGLETKVVGHTFADVVEMPTPNGSVLKKKFKEAGVALIRKWFEDEKLEISILDSKLAEEFYGYQVIGQTEHTIKYSTENDHAIAALCLAAMAMLLRVKNPYVSTQPLKSYVMPAPIAVPSDVIRKMSGIGRSNISSVEVSDHGGTFTRSRLGGYLPTERSSF